jgi:hypothetical protein
VTTGKSESHGEQIDRVRQMTEDDGETWDLSENDAAALSAVLADRDALLVALKEAEDYLASNLSPCEADCLCVLHSVQAAIAKAEG